MPFWWAPFVTNCNIVCSILYGVTDEELLALLHELNYELPQCTLFWCAFFVAHSNIILYGVTHEELQGGEDS